MSDGEIVRRRAVVSAGGARLIGELVVPSAPRGVVVLVGPGERASLASSGIADQVRRHGSVATLVMDLVTSDEDGAGDHARFQVPLLAERLSTITDWVVTADETRSLPVGYFATGIPAAAAIVTSSTRPEVRAVVCHAGRVDLAGVALEAVRVPTLLVVAAADDVMLALNRSARSHMRARTELATIPGPAHIIGDPDLETEVAQRASAWFGRCFFG